MHGLSVDKQQESTWTTKVVRGSGGEHSDAPRTSASLSFSNSPFIILSSIPDVQTCTKKQVVPTKRNLHYKRRLFVAKTNVQEQKDSSIHSN